MIEKYQRRARRADVIKYDGSNIAEIRDLMPHAEVVTYGNALMVRRNDTHIQTIAIGAYVVRGENSRVAIMQQSELESKYEKVSPCNP